jgi:hypothetical protein
VKHEDNGKSYNLTLHEKIEQISENRSNKYVISLFFLTQVIESKKNTMSWSFSGMLNFQCAGVIGSEQNELKNLILFAGLCFPDLSNKRVLI